MALVHAITGSNSEALCTLAQLRCIVEEDWARRRGRRGRKAATTEGTSHASLVVMEALDAYLAAARVSAELSLQYLHVARFQSTGEAGEKKTVRGESSRFARNAQ